MGIEAEPVDEFNSSQVDIGCRVQALLVLKLDRDRPIPQPRDTARTRWRPYMNMAFLSVCVTNMPKKEKCGHESS